MHFVEHLGILEFFYSYTGYEIITRTDKKLHGHPIYIYIALHNIQNNLISVCLCDTVWQFGNFL